MKRKLKKVNALWPQTWRFDLEPSEKSQNKKLSDLEHPRCLFRREFDGQHKCNNVFYSKSGRKWSKNHFKVDHFQLWADRRRLNRFYAKSIRPKPVWSTDSERGRHSRFKYVWHVLVARQITEKKIIKV